MQFNRELPIDCVERFPVFAVRSKYFVATFYYKPAKLLTCLVVIFKIDYYFI